MLIRLEEFEAMVAIVQEQRCNSMGLTGALPEVAESLPDLKDLCDKIGMLEKMIQHAMAKVNELETKMETAEEEFGLVDNANKIKNLLAPMFVCIFIMCYRALYECKHIYRIAFLFSEEREH